MKQISYINVTVFGDTEKYNKAYSELNEQRRNKADAPKNINDKFLSVGAGYLLSRAVKKFGAENYEIKYRANGKPYIDGSDLYFNISHSGTIAALIISDSEAGVDIENTKRKISAEFIKKSLTQNELREYNKKKTAETFFEYWTAKESYVKFRGDGLKISPNRIEIDLENKIARYAQSAAYLYTYNIESDYILSVCSAEQDFPSEIEKVEI